MIKNLKYLLLLIAIVLFTLAGCGLSDDAGSVDQLDEPVEVPEVIETLMDKVTDIVANCALQLDGEWADEYIACLDSGQGSNCSQFEDLKATLEQFREESGAKRVFILTDMEQSDDYFEITVDGSKEPRDWMEQYEIETPFLIAQDGIPCAAMSAWNDSDGEPLWSAYAPVYSSEGNVVGILAVDYPAPEVLELPDWNRDEDEWNGMDTFISSAF
jgi:hypothetical protein